MDKAPTRRIGPLLAREHGESGAMVLVLHGGPAAAGSAGPLAEGLGARFRVVEPWQRGSGGPPLTVARHVEDLRDLMEALSLSQAPMLVGASWGAMLGLAFAAAHPGWVKALALVGCGTFDKAARASLLSTLQDRAGDPHPYDFCPLTPPEEVPGDDFDVRAFTETWEDMLLLQQAGVYPAAFRAIRSPVLMLHGDHDPHPGKQILAGLKPYLPNLQYMQLERCGHSPWNEKHARAPFFSHLEGWLAAHAADA